MTTVHFNLPPELLDAAITNRLGPCLPCMMLAKGDQVDKTEAQWQAAMDDPGDKPRWIAYPDGCGEIREAVAMGIYDPLPGQLMPVCWDHMAALRRLPANERPKPPARIQPARGLPPGLNGKKGYFG